MFTRKDIKPVNRPKNGKKPTIMTPFNFSSKPKTSRRASLVNVKIAQKKATARNKKKQNN